MRRLFTILGIVLGVVVLGFAGVYGFLKWENRNDPPPVKLSVGGGTTTGPNTTAAAASAGVWRVIPGGQSFVGYRVNEKLAGVPVNSDAVSRSAAVDATLEMDGTTVKVVQVNADLRQLKSDQTRRDAYIRTQGLESDKFPMAAFVLSKPIQLPKVPAEGEAIKATASGKLTLHGVTKDVDIPLEAKRTGSTIEVVGSLDVNFADYQIQPPNIGGVVTVSDKGKIELQLFFQPG